MKLSEKTCLNQILGSWELTSVVQFIADQQKHCTESCQQTSKEHDFDNKTAIWKLRLQVKHCSLSS